MKKKSLTAIPVRLKIKQNAAVPLFCIIFLRRYYPYQVKGFGNLSVSADMVSTPDLCGCEASITQFSAFVKHLHHFFAIFFVILTTKNNAVSVDKP